MCCDRLPLGGAELDIAVLFADLRGSTAMGEHLAPSAYAALLNQFYNSATEVLVSHDAIIDKLIGDEVMALFIPGICGPNITAARCRQCLTCSELLDTTERGKHGCRSKRRSIQASPMSEMWRGQSHGLYRTWRFGQHGLATLVAGCGRRSLNQ